MTSRDWTQPQPLGAGSIRVVEDNGSYVIELDGVRRAYRGQRARAERDAEAILLALAPENTCPACGRHVALRHGFIPGHDQPHLWSEERRACPGSGLKAGR